MAKIVTDSNKLVADLKELESRPTYYRNKFPDNLCYVHDDGRTSADCVNLYKALLNGYDVSNRSVGYYQSNLSNTGDVTEWGLLKQCSDISKDFSKLKDGEPRLLYMSGHIGGYVGEFQKYGHTYNVVECTASWNGGILFSYVDKGGNRYKSKDGSMRGKWTHHGLMTPWVKYTDAAEFDEISDTVVPVNDDKPRTQPTSHEGSTVAHYMDKEYCMSYKVIANRGLNLRAGVGVSTPSICIMPFGSVVNCYGYFDIDKNGDTWLYVTFGNKVGFCKYDFLQ